MANKPSAIIFDVNEILIDMNPLRQRVKELLANRGFRIWFNMQPHNSLVDNRTN
jgi:hypothetical protein